MGLPISGYGWMTVVTTLAALATIVAVLLQLRDRPSDKNRRARRRD
jgi:hypothetical protein